jgi:hypothetical protein
MAWAKQHSLRLAPHQLQLVRHAKVVVPLTIAKNGLCYGRPIRQLLKGTNNPVQPHIQETVDFSGRTMQRRPHFYLQRAQNMNRQGLATTSLDQYLEVTLPMMILA